MSDDRRDAQVGEFGAEPENALGISVEVAFVRRFDPRACGARARRDSSRSARRSVSRRRRQIGCTFQVPEGGPLTQTRPSSPVRPLATQLRKNTSIADLPR